MRRRVPHLVAWSIDGVAHQDADPGLSAEFSVSLPLIELAVCLAPHYPKALHRGSATCPHLHGSYLLAEVAGLKIRDLNTVDTPRQFPKQKLLHCIDPGVSHAPMEQLHIQLPPKSVDLRRRSAGPKRAGEVLAIQC